MHNDIFDLDIYLIEDIYIMAIIDITVYFPMMYLKSITFANYLLLIYWLYHDCWCPGDLSHQVISSPGIASFDWQLIVAGGWGLSPRHVALTTTDALGLLCSQQPWCWGCHGNRWQTIGNGCCRLHNHRTQLNIMLGYCIDHISDAGSSPCFL